MSLPSVLGKDQQCDAWFNTDGFKEQIDMDLANKNLQGFRWVWSKCGVKITNGNITPTGTPMTFLDYTTSVQVPPESDWFKNNMIRILKLYGLKTSQEVLGRPPSGGRRKLRGSRKQRKQSRDRKQTKRR